MLISTPFSPPLQRLILLSECLTHSISLSPSVAILISEEFPSYYSSIRSHFDLLPVFHLSLTPTSQCDLFREKIARVSLGNVSHWSDYCGAPHSYEEGVDYFLNKFLSSNKDKTRDVYYHVTCATDTGNIRFVLDSCTEILLRDDLDKLGIISR